MKSNNLSLAPTLGSAEREVLLQHFPSGVVALDLETTGLSPFSDSILELSAIKLTAGACEEFFDQLINPDRIIPPSVVSIHGIDNKMVENSPRIGEILPAFWDFCGDLPLIAHNAKFDLGFLVFQSKKSGHLPLGNNLVYCSCQFSRSAFPQFEQYKLGYLAKKLGITLQNHHRALEDAKASLGIFVEGLKNLDPLKKSLQKSLLFSVHDFDGRSNIELPEELRIVQEATRDQTTIEIEYDGGSYRRQFRPVRPVAVVPMPKGNVLYAHCLISDQYKSFAIKKVLRARYP